MPSQSGWSALVPSWLRQLLRVVQRKEGVGGAYPSPTLANPPPRPTLPAMAESSTNSDSAANNGPVSVWRHRHGFTPFRALMAAPLVLECPKLTARSKYSMVESKAS